MARQRASGLGDAHDVYGGIGRNGAVAGSDALGGLHLRSGAGRDVLTRPWHAHHVHRSEDLPLGASRSC